MHAAMLKQLVAAAALAALIAAPASALQKKGKSPAGQSEPDDRQGDGRDPGPPPAAQPLYAPPGYGAPAPPPGRYVVLTEGQKRCGVQHRCDLDSRSPCPPCW